MLFVLFLKLQGILALLGSDYFDFARVFLLRRYFYILLLCEQRDRLALLLSHVKQLQVIENRQGFFFDVGRGHLALGRLSRAKLLLFADRIVTLF